jgi:hypothetical protein
VRNALAMLASRRSRVAESEVTRLRARRPVGAALVAYLRSAVALSDDEASRIRGHTNKWESREMARALIDIGYDVDVIDFNNATFAPERRYHVVVALDGRLTSLAQQAGAERRLLHITGSYPPFQNAAEKRRLRELEERRGIACKPRRVVSDTEEFVAAIETASSCSLLGNAFTLGTFPEGLRANITLLPVTGSTVTWRKSVADYVPQEREFLWFFGSGAIHKGLDRTLEAFSCAPALRLNVVGAVRDEHDFFDAYRRELTETPNITWWGSLDPASPEFNAVAAKCVAFIAPSCSESISSAAVTMMQMGLYPIVSRETGVSLPDNAGTYLCSCSVEEIVEAANAVTRLGERRLCREIAQTQAFATKAYSQARFSAEIRAYLRRALA